jgi:hypothetical protein
MAASKKATPKTGVTPFPLQDEKANQKRVPPRGQAKKQTKTTSPSPKKRGTPSAALTAVEERTISRQGAKGGKSSGSRAGLISSSKKIRRA